MFPPRLHKNAGFTLIEVILSLAMILTLSVSLTQLLRGNFDLVENLGQRSRVMHRLSVGVQTIANDLQHAFLVPDDRNLERFGDPGKRKMKTIFKIEVGNDSDTLSFTTMSHVPLEANSASSDAVYVTYRLQEAKDLPGRTHLYRGVTPRIPEDFNIDIPMKVIARHIKSFKVEFWRGDEFKADNWDSTRRGQKNKLPHMVKITLESWEEDPLDEQDRGKFTREDGPTADLHTVVYLPNSLGFKELRQASKSVRFDKL